MNITKQAFSDPYIKFFLVAFFVLLSGCVQVGFNCDITNIEEPDVQAALEECRDNPGVKLEKDF